MQLLIEYAKNEKWEEMDACIPGVCNEKEIIDWVIQKGLYDRNGNVRDLAVSILEKSQYILHDEDMFLLDKLLLTDENKYVQFRAAFTLFNRGKRTKEVLDKMEEALKDNDVKKIASEYLAKNI